VGTNYGPAPSTGFTLADQRPPGVAFVSATRESPLTRTTRAVASRGGAVTCTAPSVTAKPAAESSLTLPSQPVPAGTVDVAVLLNVATVHGNEK
jgi:hypothetical protein